MLLRKITDDKKSDSQREKGKKKPSHTQDFYHTQYVRNKWK